MILCILKGEMPYKMHEIIFFPEKNYLCAYPTLNFQTCYPKHTYIFSWPYLYSGTLRTLRRDGT